MKLYIYKNNLCDPSRNIGVARQLPTSKEVDEYINLFVASLDPKYFSNWRIFITNDEVEFVEVDHYVLIDEPYKLGLNGNRIKEISVKDIAHNVNVKFMAVEKRRSKRKAEADKFLGVVKGDESVRDVIRKELSNDS